MNARRSPPGLPLGDDLLALVLASLRPSDLAAAEGVCQRWRRVAHEHHLWQPHVAAAAGAVGAQQQQRLRQRQQRGAHAAEVPWKQVFLEAKWRHAFASPADHIRTVRVEREAHGGAAVTALSAAAGGGSLLLSAGADGSLCLWDLSPCCAPSSGGGSAPLRPRLLCRAQHPAPVVWAQLLAPDTAVSATTASAFVWRIDQQPEGQWLGAAGGAAGGAAAAATAAADHSSSAQQPAFRLLRSFAVEGGVTCAAAWDQYLAAGCADGAVRIYDTYTGSCSKLLRLHHGGVSALQHVRHGELDLLASGGADGRLLLSDSGSTLTLAEAKVLRGGVSCLLLDARSGRLLAGSTAPGASHHCWMAGQHLSGLPTPAQRLRMSGNARLPQLGHAGVAALTAAALPLFGGGSLFLGGCGAGVVHICSLETGATLQSFRPPDPSRAANGQGQQGQQAQHAGQAQRHSSSCGSASGDSSAAAASGSSSAAQRRQQGGRPGLVSPTGARHQSCLCVCAATMPVAAGFADGRLVFWRWRRRGSAPAAEQVEPAAAPAADGQAAGGGGRAGAAAAGGGM